MTFSTCSLDRRPCFVCAAMDLALPSGVRGPVLLPPCNLQRVRPPMAGFWQSVPRRVLAKHLVPGQPGPKRVAMPVSISSAWLTLFTIYFRRSRGWAFDHRSWSPFEGVNPVPWSAHRDQRTTAQGPRDTPHRRLDDEKTFYEHHLIILVASPQEASGASYPSPSTSRLLSRG